MDDRGARAVLVGARICTSACGPDRACGLWPLLVSNGLGNALEEEGEGDGEGGDEEDDEGEEDEEGEEEEEDEEDDEEEMTMKKKKKL
jgi:hypothetical protein